MVLEAPHKRVKSQGPERMISENKMAMFGNLLTVRQCSLFLRVTIARI